MRRVRSQLTYANVVATLALFIALGGGTAAALSGSNTVQSDDLGPGAQVRAPDVADNAVGSPDVINNSLTGADIKNKSGVDTCVNTVRLGNLCFRAENQARPWLAAAQHCANLNLRLPSHTEAKALAANYDLPNVEQSEDFWTEETVSRGPNEDEWAFVESDAASSGFSLTRWDLSAETVCVTTPTN
jgi:hypothetical protein